MKAKFSSWRTRIFGYALLLVQSILIITLFLQMLGDRYTDVWKGYLDKETQHTIYLNNVANDKADQIENYLEISAQKYNLLIAKKNFTTDSVSNGQINIGLWGTAKNKKLNFNYLGQDIITTHDIARLLNDKNEKATLGVGHGSANTIKKIASFPFSSNVVIQKMNYYNKQNGGITGKYQLIGDLNSQNYQNFLQGLAKISHKSKQDLTIAKGGSVTDEGILQLALIVFNLAILLLLFCYFVIYFIRSLSKYGTLILLGWSKEKIFIYEILPYIAATFIFTLLLGIGAIWSINKGEFLSEIFNYVFGLSISSVILNLLLFTISFSPILFSKNIDLIKNRFPKKVLYFFASLLYFGVNIGIVVTSIALDKPMQSVVNNRIQAQQWERVEKMMILNKANSGSDGAQMYDANSDFNRDMYNFYSAISKKTGVYIIHTDYTSQRWINLHAPQLSKPFWIYQVSPNYAKKLGIRLSRQQLASAYRGVRLYLLPKNRNTQVMRKYIQNQDLNGVSNDDIPTQFLKSRKFSFDNYQPRKLFTWNTAVNEPILTNKPIIYIVTPQNMTYFEIGNLSASGLDGYLKFKDKQVQKQYINSYFMTKYNLADNKLEFLPIEEYINGLQKQLLQTIQWFYLIFLILLVLLIFALIIIATIFKVANKEKIAVKTFLGYSILKIYWPIILSILGINIFDLIFVLFKKSKIGILIVVVSLVIQGVIFYYYVQHDKLKRIVKVFKGDRS